jgi:threonine dehydratase
MKLTSAPTLDDIQAAHEMIRPYIEYTPLLQSSQLNNISGSKLFFKCENFQKAGAFKSRGATHALLQLGKNQLKNGVVTHSSGNHAQALARAAAILGHKAYIVMPENAPSVKVAAVKQYGGLITFCKPTLQAREETTEAIVKQTGATVVHPYNDYDIIAGQATACLEMLKQGPLPDYILCPVGGGGLLSGTLLSAYYQSPHTKVIACEPEGANDTWKSIKTGSLVPSINPQTIADGLLTSLGSLTYPIIKQYVNEVITVSDEAIIHAMRLVWERMKIIIEPSSAVPVAVALSAPEFLKNKTVGIIISGGNIDLTKIPWL